MAYPQPACQRRASAVTDHPPLSSTVTSLSSDSPCSGLAVSTLLEGPSSQQPVNNDIQQHVKVYMKPFSTFSQYGKDVNKERQNTSLNTVWVLKMTKITDFRLKMRPVFPQLNRTGRAYDVIGHQKYACFLI